MEELALAPHPEGGWFRRTWTAETRLADGRAAGSSIHYLLDDSPVDATPPDGRRPGGRPPGGSRSDGSRSGGTRSGGSRASRWHRIDASELWIHLDGAALELSRWTPTEGLRVEVIGPRRQAVVQPHEWQRARTTGGWSLVVCVVVPEFTYDGFELAPADWAPSTDAPG